MRKGLNPKLLYGGIDPFEALVFLTTKYTMLPDIFEVFGRETAMHFIEVFGGKTFKVPPQEEIEKSLSHLAIWSAMREKDDPTTVRRLGARFHMTPGEIRACYRRVQEMFNGQGKRFEAAVQDIVDQTAGSNHVDAGGGGLDNLFGADDD